MTKRKRGNTLVTESKLQKLSREVNFMKFRLTSATITIQDAWRLINRMTPERTHLGGQGEGINRMLELLNRRYQATKLETTLRRQRGQK